jgi:hypothetical protein
MRKLAAGALAAVTATTILAAARPAAADPTPLSLVGNECGLTGSGTGYDQIRFWLETDTSGSRIAETTGDSLAITYGEEWVVAVGDTVEITLEGYVGDTLVDSESIVVGPCATGSAISVTANEVGAPPAPGFSIGVTVHPCTGQYFAVTLDLEAGQNGVVPVPPGEWCVSVGSFPLEVIGIDISPDQFDVPAGSVALTTLTIDWTGVRVLLREEWHLGAQVFTSRPPGLDVTPFSMTWESFDGVNVLDTDLCDFAEPDSDHMSCDGFPRLRPGGTFEVALAAPTGYSIQDGSFDESDCTNVHVADRDFCQLSVVIEGPPLAGGGGGSGASVCPVNATNPFVDLAPNGEHTPNVVCAAALGLLKGGAGGAAADRFAPTGTTTRGQLATLVANLLRSRGVAVPTATPPGPFSDDDGHVHEASVNGLAALGVVGGNGESGSSYFPDRAATRAEIASFLAEAYAIVHGSPLPAGSNAFGDDDGHPLEDAIQRLAAAGVIVGKAPGVFDPDADVTREQIASMLVALVKLL